MEMVQIYNLKTSSKNHPNMDKQTKQNPNQTTKPTKQKQNPTKQQNQTKQTKPNN